MPNKPMASNAVNTAPANTAALSDSQATRVLVHNALRMRQNIFSATVSPMTNPVINIIPRNVGIIQRFVVEIDGTITAGANQLNLTDFGLANVLQNVTFYDLNNNLRINTTGQHLVLLSTVKRRRPFAATAAWNLVSPDTSTVPPTATRFNLSQAMKVPAAYWPVFSLEGDGAFGVPASSTARFRMIYEIPISYSDDDLRGAIFANVINSTMNLQLTLNVTNFAVNTLADDTFAVFSAAASSPSGATPPFITAMQATVNVYQEYMDQLPINPKTGTLILPTTSLSTVYELKNTNLQAVTAGQDFPIPFTNFRNFFSAFVIYNNNGGMGGRAWGSDINYWSHTTANFTNIFKYDPLYNVMLTREVIMSDLPAGCYYFNFRKQPIWTTQFGNQQINLNASIAGAQAYAQVMWEDMALQNTLSGGASLPAS